MTQELTSKPDYRLPIAAKWAVPREVKDTRVVFEISSNGPARTVTMTHDGLVPGIECYENCEKVWGFYIGGSLQKLLTENQGIPDGRRRQGSAAKAPAEAR